MEKWATIKDFPNYEISDLGVVKNTITDQVLSTKEDRGYTRVALYNNGSKYYKQIHRLVAEAYIENPFDKKEVNHIDGNKHNNSYHNLEWCTRSENMTHAFRNGLKKPSGGLPPKKVMIIETGEVYDSINECARDINGDRAHIQGCLYGKRMPHKGYHFRYA